MILIDADELLKRLQKVKDEDPINLLVAREKVLEIILNAPPVELTELCKGCQYLKDCETCEEKLGPQGEWRHYEQVIKCLNCNHEFYDEIMEYCGDDVPKFCPNCGADMKGGAE